MALSRKYTRGLTFDTRPLLEKAAERKEHRARAAALKKQGIAPGESSAPLSKLRSRARGPNVQDVLGTPPDTPVHIIIPDHELAFEWLAPKGGEAGRDVDVPGVVWERERESVCERLESHDGDKAVGEEGMGVKEGGVESMEVLDGGGGLSGVYAVQEDGGGVVIEDEVLGEEEEEEEVEEVLDLPAGMETAVVVPDDESQADAAVRAAWEQGDCVDPARRKFSKSTLYSDFIWEMSCDFV